MMSPNKIQTMVQEPLLLDYPGFELLVASELQNIAEQTSQLLAEYPQTMLQYTPEQILKYIHNQQAFAIWDAIEHKLIGFVKIMLWPGKDDDGQAVYEFGSWVVSTPYKNKGYGKLLLQVMLKYFKKHYQQAKLIAVVESTIKGQAKHIVLEKAGAQKISKPINVDIQLTAGHEDVLIYQLN